MEKLFLFAKRFVLQLIVIVFVFFPVHGKIVDNLKQG